MKLGSSRFFKWARLRSDDSASKRPSSPKMKLTLGSRVNGKGHFWTMKSFFSTEGDEAHSMDETLKGSEHSTQKSVHDCDWRDAEMGLAGN